MGWDCGSEFEKKLQKELISFWDFFIYKHYNNITLYNNLMDFNLEEIIDLNWEEEERIVIERIVKHFKSWKRYIPSKIENDIIYIIKLAIREKKKIIELESKL